MITDLLTTIDDFVWGLPLIILIISCGVWLTVRTGLLQVFHLGKALRFMVKNEDDGHGEVTSFGALCTALSATIGTGNIVGVASAIAAGGPGALFWMEIAAFFGMATKYAEGLLAIKYRQIDEDGHVLGGPFYYIEKGMGKGWPNASPYSELWPDFWVSVPSPRSTASPLPHRTSLIRKKRTWYLPSDPVTPLQSLP